LEALRKEEKSYRMSRHGFFDLCSLRLVSMISGRSFIVVQHVMLPEGHGIPIRTPLIPTLAIRWVAPSTWREIGGQAVMSGSLGELVAGAVVMSVNANRYISCSLQCLSLRHLAKFRCIVDETGRDGIRIRNNSGLCSASELPSYNPSARWTYHGCLLHVAGSRI
jgi:hypothetical protein